MGFFAIFVKVGFLWQVMKGFKVVKKVFSCLMVTLLWGTFFFVIYGCSPEAKFDGTRYSLGGGGILNDSMALFKIDVIDLYSYDEALGISRGGTEHRLRECNLALVDIRFEKIYWQKKISVENCDNLTASMIDSVLFFSKEGVCKNNGGRCHFIERIAVQKLQDMKRIEFKLEKIDLKGKGWEYYENAVIRPWRDGLILANNRDRQFVDFAVYSQ